MIKIRSGVFETNSSSTHSLTVVNNDVYRKWLNDSVRFRPSEEDFLNTKESLEFNLNLIETNELELINYIEYSYNDKEGTVIDVDKTIHKIIRNINNYNVYRVCIEDFYLTNEQYVYYYSNNYDGEEVEDYKTINGEKFVVFGYYGRC